MTDLTRRQQQVAALVARGMSAKAVARELGVSRRTAEDHISSAASRLPGEGRPRHKCAIWFFSMTEDAAA